MKNVTKKIAVNNVKKSGAKIKKLAVTQTVETIAADAPVIEKTEKPVLKLGKYGAPSVRINRENKSAPSVLGDRKWIYRGATEFNLETLEILAFSETTATKLPKHIAEKILAAALKRPDVINGRLYYSKTIDGVEYRTVWLAFVADNGDHRILTIA